MNLLRRLERLEQKQEVTLVVDDQSPRPRTLLDKIVCRASVSWRVTMADLDLMLDTLRAAMAAEAQGVSFEFSAEYQAAFLRWAGAVQDAALELTGRPYMELVREGLIGSMRGKA